MNWLLLFTSIILETCKNAFSNKFSKEKLKCASDIYKFNMILYIGSFVFLIFCGNKDVSGYTLILALLFAFVTAAAQHYYLKALNEGSFAFTAFVQGCNLVIPTIYGAFFLGERLTFLKICAVIILTFSTALALDVKSEKIKTKCLIFSLFSMIFTGFVGILQTVHQLSEHKEELIGFLFYSFLFSVVMNFALWRIEEKKKPSELKLDKSSVTLAVFSGIFIGAVNIINLYLAGVMPKTVFYPVVNGGLIIMTLLSAVIFFHERLNKKQVLGLTAGIIAMCVLSI